MYKQAAKIKTNAPNRLAETTFINRIFGGYLRSQVRSPPALAFFFRLKNFRGGFGSWEGSLRASRTESLGCRGGGLAL